jgi:hypothetical protein
MVSELRTFLVGALYSGSPWTGEYEYPSAGLNPVDIDPAADKTAGPLVERAREELSGYRRDRGWRGLWRRATSWWPWRKDAEPPAAAAV